MANRVIVEAVHILCQQLGNPRLPFGGKAILAVGDFRQVAPVVRGGSLADVIDASIKSSLLWPSFYILHLTQPIRNALDPEFSSYVDDIGENTEQKQTIKLRMLETLHSIPQALDWLYPPEILCSPRHSIRRSYLAPLNSQVEEINSYILDQLPGSAGQLCTLPTVKLLQC